jgi:hypothetical protein
MLDDLLSGELVRAAFIGVACMNVLLLLLSPGDAPRSLSVGRLSLALFNGVTAYAFLTLLHKPVTPTTYLYCASVILSTWAAVRSRIERRNGL